MTRIYSIPPTSRYKYKGKELDKAGIERTLTFADKLNSAIPALISKDIRKDDPKTHEIIMELKAYRDSIVHLKERPGTPTAYQHIFASALDWNYKKYLDATAELINYLIPCTIELCPCSRSY